MARNASHSDSSSSSIAPAAEGVVGSGETAAQASTGASGTAGDATEAKAADTREVKVTDPETGQPIARKAMILKLVDQGLNRSQITAKMREITGNPNFRYQNVFQATKGFTRETHPALFGGRNDNPKPATPAVPAPVAGATS